MLATPNTHTRVRKTWNLPCAHSSFTKENEASPDGWHLSKLAGHAREKLSGHATQDREWVMRRSRCLPRRLARLALGSLGSLGCAEAHIVALLAVYTDSTLLLSCVSTPVVVDGERFMDAVFAAAGRG